MIGSRGAGQQVWLEAFFDQQGRKGRCQLPCTRSALTRESWVGRASKKIHSYEIARRDDRAGKVVDAVVTRPIVQCAGKLVANIVRDGFQGFQR
ncbi:hypothetical protein CSC70_08425 [Pseudoxanthomonas kalamensis DSM 18571]|nr:hypothetical protein CSC70_08425 [Pseudoxanthomonas kalamensis DSM 18571]